MLCICYLLCFVYSFIYLSIYDPFVPENISCVNSSIVNVSGISIGSVYLFRCKILLIDACIKGVCIGWEGKGRDGESIYVYVQYHQFFTFHLRNRVSILHTYIHIYIVCVQPAGNISGLSIIHIQSSFTKILGWPRSDLGGKCGGKVYGEREDEVVMDVVRVDSGGGLWLL